VQTPLETWLVLGAVTSGVMALGLKSAFGRLTLRHWGRLAVMVPLWPLGLASTLLAALGYRGASGVLEYIAFNWVDRLCDWYLLWRLRKLGVDGGSLAYLKDLNGLNAGGPVARVALASYEDVIMDPDIFVQFGGMLPPGRPQGDAIIRVKKGVAQWE
jgi:hypothetical protein